MKVLRERPLVNGYVARQVEVDPGGHLAIEIRKDGVLYATCRGTDWAGARQYAETEQPVAGVLVLSEKDRNIFRRLECGS